MTSIPGFLAASAALHPDRPALILDHSVLTYGELDARSTHLAQSMIAYGLKRGERVALLWENSLEWVVCYYAVLKAGGVVAPLNNDLKVEGLNAIVHNLDPRLLLVSKRFARLLKAAQLMDRGRMIILQNLRDSVLAQEAGLLAYEDLLSEHYPLPLPPLGEADLANIIYTSGSTAEPKGVMLSHGNICHNVAAICQYQQLMPSDRHLLVLPFFYVMGLSVLNTHMAVGAAVVINNNFAYPAQVIEQMVRERVTGFSGVPSTFAFLLHRSPMSQRREELGSLRLVAQAGGHMAESIKRQLREALPDHVDIFIMYGATEASARLSYLPPVDFERKMGSIGKAIPGVDLRVLDERGSECPTGVVGELVASGPNIMQGYFKDPAGTARVLNARGYRTGDLAYRDEQGYLFLVGRQDSLLKVGGHRVSPQEIENLILDTRMALEVAVIGVDDELLGQRLVAVVGGLRDDVDDQRFENACRALLPKIKMPSDFVYLPNLPKKSNGKLDKLALRDSLFAVCGKASVYLACVMPPLEKYFSLTASFTG